MIINSSLIVVVVVVAVCQVDAAFRTAVVAVEIKVAVVDVKTELQL